MRIGSYSPIGAGAVVTKSVSDNSRVTSAQQIVTQRKISSSAPEPGSNEHMKDFYSIWK